MAQNKRIFWTHNPSIGHIHIRKQGNNMEILYIV